MPNKEQYINLYFTKDDKEVLTWANMIRENNLKLGTWIQGILVAEIKNEDLDIGSIQSPNPSQITLKRNSNPFGDDTNSKKNITKTGWNIRGENKELIAGSVLSIKVTRPIVQEALNNLKEKHKFVGAYIKAIIRKKLKESTSNQIRLPKITDVLDLFCLTENKITPPNTHKKATQNTQETQNMQKKLQQHPQQGRGEEISNQDQPQKSRNPLLIYIDKTGQQ